MKTVVVDMFFTFFFTVFLHLFGVFCVFLKYYL